MKRVTFGVVNCNRLFYMKSCIETLLETTRGYTNKELIVVDNASVEQGTKEYLDSLADRDVSVIRRDTRNPSNEFAIGLNIITSKATGDYVCLLQGDMQFILKDWLGDFVNFYDKNIDVVGSLMLDAQRRQTHATHQMYMFNEDRQGSGRNRFYADISREAVAPAADAMFSRQALEYMGPWSEDNKNHEGSMDSENDMRNRVKRLVGEKKMPRYVTALSAVPPAVAIYTDPRGTQGRVRGNRRYGSYWGAKDSTGTKYYEYVNVDDFDTYVVNPIEAVAKTIGFDRPIDATGSWLKNPIRPETATKSDWVEL